MSKSKTLELSVELRDEMGTAASRRMRREGKVPGVIYGHGSEATPLLLSADLVKQLQHHPGLLSLTIGADQKCTGIVKDVQRHPITGAVLHIDFQEVKADQIITATVAIEPHGEPVGASQGGMLEQLVHELEIRCRPLDLIEVLIVEVSDMKLDEVMTVGQLVLPEGITTPLSADLPVFQVRQPKVVEAAEEAAAEAAGEAGSEAGTGNE